MAQITTQALSSPKRPQLFGIHQQLYKIRMKAQKTEFFIIWLLLLANTTLMMKPQFLSTSQYQGDLLKSIDNC